MRHLASNVLFIPLVLPSPDFPSPPTDVMTQPLQVYTRRLCPPTWPLVESSSMPQSSATPVPQSSYDLLIAIRKGTRSTFNPHPVYNFLVRLSLIRARNRQWLRKFMLFNPMAHGSLSLFRLASLPLVVVGFIQ